MDENGEKKVKKMLIGGQVGSEEECYEFIFIVEIFRVEERFGKLARKERKK